MTCDAEFVAVPSDVAVRTLLQQIGMAGPFQIQDLPSGRNNRVFRIDVGSTPLLLKRYFHHPDDPRNRLATEFAWTSFAARNGIKCVPRPLACSPNDHLGLYEFIVGDKLTGDKLQDEHMAQAIRFFRDINRLRHQKDAASLPLASEACFSLEEHFACVESRLNRLQMLVPSSETDVRMRRWLDRNLVPTWQRILKQTIERHDGTGHSRNVSLRDGQRCLSPSDFGFHNAIQEASGELRFLDFEYAGWDDPAKVVCDFFCQIDVPVPLSHFAELSSAVVEEMEDDGSLAERIAALLPIYRIKWCCIVLNDFLPIDGLRRAFADDATLRDIRKQNQLVLAERLLMNLNECGTTP